METTKISKNQKKQYIINTMYLIHIFIIITFGVFMYLSNQTQVMFHEEIETALLEFVEHGNKRLLLDRIKFYNDMEQIIKKHNTEYFVRLLDSSDDCIQFEISINNFL